MSFLRQTESLPDWLGQAQDPGYRIEPNVGIEPTTFILPR